VLIDSVEVVTYQNGQTQIFTQDNINVLFGLDIALKTMALACGPVVFGQDYASSQAYHNLDFMNLFCAGSDLAGCTTSLQAASQVPSNAIWENLCNTFTNYIDTIKCNATDPALQNQVLQACVNFPRTKFNVQLTKIVY